MDKRHDSIGGHQGQVQQPAPSAAELQRRLHDTRNSITETVAEMKSTMNTQYNTAKDRAVESLDWKLQMRKYPVAACLGALAVGYLAGRGLASATDEHEDEYIGSGIQEHDFTTMHGSSHVPEPRHSITERIIPPQARARMASRVEDVLGNLTEHFLGELTRVGREVVVPGIIGAITSKLSSTTDSSSTQYNTGHQNAGGTGSFGSGTTNRGTSYQGRSL